MLKNLSNIGKSLNKSEQKAINGGCPPGGGNVCSGYTGPIVVTCEQYYNLPPQFTFCVLVSVDCFPQ